MKGLRKGCCHGENGDPDSVWTVCDARASRCNERDPPAALSHHVLRAVANDREATAVVQVSNMRINGDHRLILVEVDSREW